MIVSPFNKLNQNFICKQLVFTNSGQIHLKGDQCGCVEEVNSEGEIEIDRPNECPQDDQDPENPGFLDVEIYNIGKIMQNGICTIFASINMQKHGL